MRHKGCGGYIVIDPAREYQDQSEDRPMLAYVTVCGLCKVEIKDEAQVEPEVM